MRIRSLLPCALATALAACGGDGGSPSGGQAPDEPGGSDESAARREPDRVKVDHILVGVRDAPRLNARLTVKQARKLAYEIVDKLEDNPSLWPSLKRRHSKDTGGGVYTMTNHGVRPTGLEMARDGMVASFGDVAFGLEVGDIAVADYHPRKSPFGFHVIKRLE